MRGFGVEWDDRTVTALLNAFAQTGDIEAAMRTCTEAEASGITMNEFMAAALIRAQTAQRHGVDKAGKLAKLKELYDWSRALARGTEKVPGPVFDAYVGCLGLLNRYQEALDVYKNRAEENIPIRAGALENAVAAQLRLGIPRQRMTPEGERIPVQVPEGQRVGNLRAALALMEEAKQAGVAPSLPARTAIATSAVRVRDDRQAAGSAVCPVGGQRALLDLELTTAPRATTTTPRKAPLTRFTCTHRSSNNMSPRTQRLGQSLRRLWRTSSLRMCAPFEHMDGSYRERV